MKSLKALISSAVIINSPFPLNTPDKFAWTIRVEIEKLSEIADHYESFYFPFKKEKNGKERVIDHPKGKLKDVQTKINKKILARFPYPDFIVGGVRGKELRDHLKLHVGKEVVVTLDIEKCFPRITSSQIYNVWIDLGAIPDTARLATRLTTYKGHLPLGAPTSSLLSNLALLPCLIEVKEITEKHNFSISQFVDDSALSGKTLRDDMITEICKVFSRYNFRINRKKVLVMRSNKSQKITKKQVNRNMGIPRSERDKIRAGIYQLLKMSKNTKEYHRSLSNLKGRVIHAGQFNPSFAETMLRKLDAKVV